MCRNQRFAKGVASEPAVSRVLFANKRERQHEEDIQKVRTEFALDFNKINKRGRRSMNVESSNTAYSNASMQDRPLLPFVHAPSSSTNLQMDVS
jgi:hypothetical protein